MMKDPNVLQLLFTLCKILIQVSQYTCIVLVLDYFFSSAQLDDGGHGDVAEGVCGVAAVREELQRLSGHGEHFTSVGPPQHTLLRTCSFFYTV